MARTCSAYPVLPATLVLLLLTACGGGAGGSDSSSEVPPNPALAAGVTLGNAQIAAMLYADNARTPADFYAEPLPQSQQYIATSHLKNVDLGDTGTLHELCTDDWNQALAWSEAAAQRSPQYRALVANEVNARFFQFDRVSGSQPQLYQRGRIFHCTYLDRSGVDLQQLQGQAGQLNLRPIAAADLKLLSEYLWQFTSYNNFGHAVLRSFAATGNGALRHSLIVANLQQANGVNGCDQISVESWTHAVDNSSGALTRSVNTLWSFGARATPTGAELCAT
jgi:hypothetical protein